MRKPLIKGYSSRPEGLTAPVLNYAAGRNFSVQSRGDETEIVIYDVIGEDFWTGEGVSAKKFAAILAEVETPGILLKINSPGGNVFDGIAIYNDLVAHKAKVRVVITGLAASAASIIAMAGDEIEIAANAHIMIHNAWVMAVGNRNDLREVADFLEDIDAALAETYAARTSQSEKNISAMMDSETWMRGQAAIDFGFADRIAGDDSSTAQAAYDISLFAAAPVGLKKQIEAALREAGYSNTESKAAVNKGFHVLGPREAAANSHHLREQREVAGDSAGIVSAIAALTQTIRSAA
jgi:ATP-dependent Clp endopeptidase proteolytic subunit ClpP